MSTESDSLAPDPGAELDLGLPPQPEPQPNYIDAIAASIGAIVPDCPQDLLRLYALLALTAGDGVTLEHVHDAWAVWRCATRPDHPSLVPFGELSREVQELDAPYRDAIRAVAAAAKVAGPESALPEGEYARVEIMGHDAHTGWVTERDRAGIRVLAVADWDGRVIAEVPGQSLYRFVPLPTPLKRPEPQTRAGQMAALTRGADEYEDYEDGEEFYDSAGVIG